MKTRYNDTNYAILVVDMLNDFVYGKLRCAKAEKIIPTIKSLLEITRSKQIPVFYCNDAHLKNDDYEFKLWGSHAIKGTKGAKIISDLRPSKTDHVISKRTYSAFYNTKLEETLAKEFGRKKPTLIITGIHTNICAKHTAFDAFVRGYGVIIPEDAVTSFRLQDHKSALEYVKNNYGAKILKTSKVIDMLSKSQ